VTSPGNPEIGETNWGSHLNARLDFIESEVTGVRAGTTGPASVVSQFKTWADTTFAGYLT